MKWSSGGPGWRLLLAGSAVNAGTYLHLGYHLMLLNSTQGLVRDFMRTAGGIEGESDWRSLTETVSGKMKSENFGRKYCPLLITR